MASKSRNRRQSDRGQSDLGLNMAEAAMAGQQPPATMGPMGGGMTAGPMAPPSVLPGGMTAGPMEPLGGMAPGLGYGAARERMHNQFGDALEFLRGQREAARRPASDPAPGMPPAELARLGMGVAPDGGDMQEFLNSPVGQELMKWRRGFLARGGSPAAGGFGGFGGMGRGGSMGTGPAGGGGFGNAGQGMGGGVGPGTGGVY